jgi:hypothetical protein
MRGDGAAELGAGITTVHPAAIRAAEAPASGSAGPG